MGGEVELNEKKIAIIPLDRINEYYYDYVVVAFRKVIEGRQALIDNGVAPEKIVCYHFNDGYRYKDNPYQQRVDIMFRKEWQSQVIPRLFDIPEKRYYLCSTNLPDDGLDIEWDFVREKTLHLLSNEIRRKNLDGACAELGVYKGRFSKLINGEFPDKTMYLFDTFKGFTEDTLKKDSRISSAEYADLLNDTSVDRVLKVMPHPDKCVVKRGFFPDTFDVENEKFCLVSIDADLYDSITSGLQIFFPRLVHGGFIMIHDFNNIVYDVTTKAAVDDFCAKNRATYVPIADIGGSVVMTK